jgi:hypothetical protein
VPPTEKRSFGSCGSVVGSAVPAPLIKLIMANNSAKKPDAPDIVKLSQKAQIVKARVKTLSRQSITCQIDIYYDYGTASKSVAAVTARYASAYCTCNLFYVRARKSSARLKGSSEAVTGQKIFN